MRTIGVWAMRLVILARKCARGGAVVFLRAVVGVPLRAGWTMTARNNVTYITP